MKCCLLLLSSVYFAEYFFQMPESDVSPAGFWFVLAASTLFALPFLWDLEFTLSWQWKYSRIPYFRWYYWLDASFLNEHVTKSHFRELLFEHTHLGLYMCVHMNMHMLRYANGMSMGIHTKTHARTFTYVNTPTHSCTHIHRCKHKHTCTSVRRDTYMSCHSLLHWIVGTIP